MAMTKKENLLAAIKGQTPEQVPVAPLIHWRFAEKLLGQYHWKDTIKVHNMIGSTWFRGPICVGPNSDYDPRWGMEQKGLPNEGPGKLYQRTISNSKGTISGKHKIGFDPSDPTLGFECEYFVKEDKDWDVVRQYWLDEIEQAPMPEHEEIDEAYDVMGDNGVASVIMNSAFTRLCLMRGMQNMMLDMIDKPDFLKELQAISLEMRKKEIQSFLDSKGEVLVYDICWATGMGISPEMFTEWLSSEMEQVCDIVRKGGKYIGFYTLGRIKNLMPAMMDAKPHFVETFEQNEGDITLAEAKEEYGNQICLMGNFDPLILQDGTTEDCVKEAKRCLDEGMAGGAYVMGTGDEVPPTAKLDNLKAMVETVEKYGKY